MSDEGLHVRDVGSGRLLVLIHGWSCPGQFFDSQIEALHSHARCIVPDLPGHGQTGARVELSIEAAAEALHEALVQREVHDAVVCGWSMGALVAYAMIERFGAKRLSSFVAIDMTPKVLNTYDWRNGTLNGLNAEMNQVFLDAIVPDWARLPPLIAKRLFAEDLPAKPGLKEHARDEIAKADPVLLRSMWASLTDQDFRLLLKRFPVPFHLVAGRRSQLYGQGVHLWHEENVPDVNLHLFDRSGHAPHLEEPARFNDLLSALLRR